MNTSKKRSGSQAAFPTMSKKPQDEYGDDLSEEDLVGLLDDTPEEDFRDIESFQQPSRPPARMHDPAANMPRKSIEGSSATVPAAQWQPVQLSNGRWECNHKCKDKQNCKHPCCTDGLDRPPKPPKDPNAKGKNDAGGAVAKGVAKLQKGQTTLDPPRATQRYSQPSMVDNVDFMDLTEGKFKPPKSPKAPEFKRLGKLHSATQKGPASNVSTLIRKASAQPTRTSSHLSFMPQHMQLQEPQDESTDYGPDISDFELPDAPVESAEDRFQQDAALVADLTGSKPVERPTLPLTSTSNGYGETDSLTEEAMVGLADSQSLQYRAKFEKPKDVHEDASSTLKESAISSDMPSTKATKSTGLIAPFFEASSDSVDFIKPVVKRRPLNETNINMPTAKKPRRLEEEVLETLDQAEHQRVKLAEEKVQSQAQAAEVEDKSSGPPSEVDPMILQMFGAYVDFV